MKSEALNLLYDPENFRDLGHELVNDIADYLKDSYRDTIATNRYRLPAEMLQSWEEFFSSDHQMTDYFRKILIDSINVHNPNYMGHQVSVTAPIGALAGLISDLLSNGMAVYEMGSASNALEFMSIEILNKAIGYNENAGGFLTSGGTLANLTALLTARNVKLENDVWEKGYEGKKSGIMVSEQAHYCIDRAARVMGLGADGIIKLPVDDNFSVINDSLETKWLEAKQKGIQVFAIVASSCSTSTGSYDDIEYFASFAQKHDIWLHVDGAHGAATIMSDKYNNLVKGIQKADSVIIDCHKMMMTPTICTAALYKNREHTLATFRQKAEYLFDESESYDWYNSGKRTFECTKLMMSIKFMAIIQLAGTNGISDYVDLLYDNTQVFAELIRNESKFELAVSPQANILCFRWVDKTKSKDELNTLNSVIREKILNDGQYYIVQTVLRGTIFLRTSIMNPFTEEKHFSALLNTIRSLATTLV